MMGGKKEIYRDVQLFHGAIQLCLKYTTHTGYIAFQLQLEQALPIDGSVVHHPTIS